MHELHNGSSASGDRVTPDVADTGGGAMLDYGRPLRRQIGLFGAVMLGLGSILGTGVFVGLAQATALAGPWVLVAIVLAGALAFCNAMSSAQLAAAYPVAGGTYEYGYRLLSPAWGFTAGWTFLLAKSASAATAALAVASTGRELLQQLAAGRLWDTDLRTQWTTFGSELANPTTPIAAFLVIVMTLCVLAHVRRTAALNSGLVLITIVGLVLLIVFFFFQNQAPIPPAAIHVRGFNRGSGTSAWGFEWGPWQLSDLFQATALSFVAFTGYGRLATVGEEVRDPARTIPKAITASLLVAMSLYLVVGFIVWIAFDLWYELLHPRAPLVSIAYLVGGPRLSALAALAALTAMLGVLLNLILGLSRVWLAMGRRGDMPRVLSRVSEKSGTPVPATILAGLVIAAFVLVGDVRLTWSFSAFSVLIYYAITNWACLRLPAEHRRYPRALAWVGLVSCLSLAWFVEVKVWAVGVGLIAAGVLWHRLRVEARATLLVPSPSTLGEG